MLWTYPCTENHECIREGAIWCPRYYDRVRRDALMHAIAHYDTLRAQALQSNNRCRINQELVRGHEKEFFVTLYHPWSGIPFVRRLGKKGLLLELAVNVKYNISPNPQEEDLKGPHLPLRREMARQQSEKERAALEIVALAPLGISLYACLRKIWHASEKEPALLRRISERYRGVEVHPLSHYDNKSGQTE